MAIVKVQGNNHTGTATVLAYSGAVTVGSLLTATVRVGNTGTGTTVSCSVNGAWTQAIRRADATETVYVFYFPNTAAGTPTVTVNNPDGGTTRLVIEEWSGVATTTPVRTTSSGQGTGTSISSGDVSAVNGDLCYGSVINTNTPVGDWTAGGTSAGGTWATSQKHGTSPFPVYSQYVVASADGTFASIPVFSTSDALASTIVVFTPPASSPAPPPVVRPLLLALQKFRPGRFPNPLSFPVPDIDLRDIIPPLPTVVPLLDDRRRFTAPPAVVISGAMGAITQPAAPTPPPPVVVPVPDRPRQYRPAEVVVATHGVDITQQVVFPPRPVVVPLVEQRRRLPVDVQVSVGFPEVLPPPPTVVEAQRRRTVTPDPISLNGALAALVPPTGVTPPPPIVVPIDQRARPVVLPPTITHGFVDPGPGAVGTTPPRPINVDRTDPKRVTPDPIIQSGAYRPTGVAPAVTPPAPYVVPLEERRRLFAAAPPTYSHGFDEPRPPQPYVVEPRDDRARRRTPDPFSTNGLRQGIVPPFVKPPPPVVVPIDQRSLRQPLLQAYVFHGPIPTPDFAVAAVSVADTFTTAVGLADGGGVAVATRDTTGATATVVDGTAADTDTSDAAGADVSIRDVEP